MSRQLKEGYKMSREEALERAEKKEDKRINFVTTHSAYLPNINKILKRHGHFLKEEGLDKYIKETPRLSLRRGKNLADLVVNAKKKVGNGGSGPCGKGCKLCDETKKIDTEHYMHCKGTTYIRRKWSKDDGEMTRSDNITMVKMSKYLRQVSLK